MSEIQIFRDIPIIASRVAPRGSITSINNARLNLKYDAEDYLYGEIAYRQPRLKNLTVSSRRGNRGFRNGLARLEWQSLLRFF